MSFCNLSYERITLELDSKSTVHRSVLVITIKRTLEDRLDAKIACGS